MIYALVSALLFALLYGETARAFSPSQAGVAALIAFFGIAASLYLPPFFFKYTNSEIAPVVLSRLMRRAAIGTTLALLVTILTYLVMGQFLNPALIGELYLFTLLSIFLFQAIGEVITRHVMYLQQTMQYNSNQLAAVLFGFGFLFFVLILFFLSFDFTRPPELHVYLRDILAITLVLFGYGRAVFLMAHH